MPAICWQECSFGLQLSQGMNVGSARNPALFISCVLMTSAIGVGFLRSAYVALALLVLTAIGVPGF